MLLVPAFSLRLPHDQEPDLAGLVSAAAALASDSEARAECLDVAADFLTADSQAMALAEAMAPADSL